MDKIDTDLGLRHMADMDADTFIAKYCEVFRPHATVSEDDSYQELEKSITHVLNVKIAQGELQNAMGLDKMCVWGAREAIVDIPEDPSLATLVANAKDAQKPLQAQLETMLKTTEMGGYASGEEITAMARFLSYVLMSRG